MSFAAITLCVASQEWLLFVMTQSGNFWTHSRTCSSVTTDLGLYTSLSFTFLVSCVFSSRYTKSNYKATVLCLVYCRFETVLLIKSCKEHFVSEIHVTFIYTFKS
jgi:hypothetical protein